MEGREVKPFSGSASASYQIQRGGYSGYGSGPLPQPAGYHTSPGFRSITNPNVPVQPNARGNSMGQTLPVEPSQANANFHHGINMGAPPPPPQGEPVKRKRGRPRKYGPDGPISLALTPMSAGPNSGSITPTTPKRGRGRPPGSGRKQRLAALGEWMTESAGLAFAPHIISIAVGEDVAAKVLSFAQQRPRALCIMSGNGLVSAVTLRQPAASGGNLTYEGRFEILCLSGSYLLAESGGSRNRVGGINVSLSSPGGPVIGGSVGMLIAASPVQVIACSFVYGGNKAKNKTAAGSKGSENSPQQLGDSATPSSAPPNHHSTTPGMGFWSGSRELETKNPHTDIDLTRG